jgi:outer membrane protein OmpA-like peptidoglycan-associated protein
MLPWVGGFVALACAISAHAEPEPADPREARLVEAHSSFSGPTGGIRIIDAAAGPQGTFRLALSTEFFVIRDFFAATDEAHHFAGNLSLSITPTEYLEVYASAEVTSAWDDSNDPMLIQRVADVLLGIKGFYLARPWLAVGGDAGVAFPGGVGDGKATFRATSFGFRGNLTLDFRAHDRHRAPVITRFNGQYWFDNSAQLTQSIEDQRYEALGDEVPPSLETRNLLTPFERFAYGVNRTDHVRIAAGLEVPLKARKVGLHPMLEWRWDIPVNRQGFVCVATTFPTEDGCLAEEKAKAFPMVLTAGLRLLTPPKGLAFTVAADVGLTGTRKFVRELAPTAPYNVILAIAYAFDPRSRALVTAASAPKREPERETEAAVPPTGQLRGRVLEQGSGKPVAGAVVAAAGERIAQQVTDSEGRFAAEGLSEGEVVLEVSHPGYETAQCSAVVLSDTECVLVPSTFEGRLRLAAVDLNGNPVPQLAITVRGPSEHHLISNAEGLAVVEAISPGAYTAYVDDPAYLIAVRDLDILPREETVVELRILPKPSRPRVVVKQTEIVLRRQIGFATGSDEILASSEPILLEIADALLRNPGLELVEIQGHADNSGDFEINMQLSQRRAEAVQRWLIRHGVEPARLMSKGYGSMHPIVPNITEYNRARNRRVQLKIVRRVDAAAAAAR